MNIEKETQAAWNQLAKAVEYDLFHSLKKEFVGKPNTPENRELMGRSLKELLEEYTKGI